MRLYSNGVGFLLLLLISGLSLSAPVSRVTFLRDLPRFSLDTAYAVANGGSVGPNQLYNSGRGYSIPGPLKGDSVIGLSSTGGESIDPQMAMFERANLSLDGESSLYCNSSPARPIESGLSVFRPIEVRSRTGVSSTLINMTLGVQAESITRLRIARTYKSVATGFDSSLNDHLLLEVSEGALWAWPTQTGYTGNPAERMRLAHMSNSSSQAAVLHPYQLRITLDEPARSCSVIFGPIGVNSLRAISTILPPEFCDSYYQNQLVLALQVQSEMQTLPDLTVRSACLSELSVLSRTSR